MRSGSGGRESVFPKGVLGVRKRLDQAWGAGGRPFCGPHSRLHLVRRPAHIRGHWPESGPDPACKQLLPLPFPSLRPLAPSQASPSARAQGLNPGPMPGPRAGIAAWQARLALGPYVKRGDRPPAPLPRVGPTLGPGRGWWCPLPALTRCPGHSLEAGWIC